MNEKSVTCETSHVLMWPYVVVAATELVHHASRAVFRLSWSVNVLAITIRVKKENIRSSARPQGVPHELVALAGRAGLAVGTLPNQ